MKLRAALMSLATACSVAACVMNSPMPPAPVSNSASTDSKPSAPAPQVQALGANQYLVQKGDTLYSIGKKLGISYLKLAELNQLSVPYPIHVGQVLNLGAKTATASGNRPASDAANTATDDAEVVTAAISQPTLGASGETPATAVTTESVDAKSLPESTKTNAPLDIESIADTAIQWQWPLNGKISTGFDPQTNKGLNITGTPGQPVAAAGAGKVIYSGMDVRGYGKLIIVKHNSNLLSVYAHQGNSLVKEGSYVTQGDKLANLPSTGAAAATTLHFEIRQKGKPVDPSAYLPGSNS